MSKEEEIIVDLEVQNLLAKGVVEICFPDPNQFISNIRTIPKRDGGRRPVVDMRELNQFAEYLPFKMEDISQLKDILRRGDYITKLDLQDAYLTIPVGPKSKIFLRFFFGRACFISSHVYHSASLSISKVVHQDTEASDCLSKIYGDSSTSLLRRHPYNGRFSGASCRAHRNSDKRLGISRLRDKEKEVNFEANPDYPISRFHCKLDEDAPSIARRKTAKIKVICSISSRKCAHSQRNFKFLGSVPGSSARFANGSPPLQGYSERLDSGNFSTRRQGKLQKHYKSIKRCRVIIPPKVDSVIFFRCFNDRMGSSSSRNQHKRSLERAKSPRPYKLLGAGSSISGCQSFSASDKGESCPVWPGQPHCSSVHQPAGRYKISIPHSIGTRHMVLSSRQGHGDISNSCSREIQSHSRWKVQNLSWFNRMDA